ncbi:MAG: arginine--tRNA ligase [Patescibacteria group bacterium]
MILESVKVIIKDAFIKEYGFFPNNASFEHPVDEKWGDYATNASMTAAKQIKQNPLDIAKRVCYRVNNEIASNHKNNNEYTILESLNFAKPGFININIKKEWLLNELRNVLLENKHYGSSEIGKGKLVIVEFSQPNTNKPMHIGHSRNNFLGSSISTILAFLSYDVIRSNYVGDIGIHICKSLLMYMKYGQGKEPDKKPDHFVGDFYKLFESELEKDPKLIEEAQNLLRRWEQKDESLHKIWQKMNSWVYEGWKKTYEEENVQFDIWEYESKCQDIGKEIAEHAVRAGIAEKDATGAITAKLEKYALPDKVLLRSDGTSVYSTKDLQLAKDSFEKYQFYKRLYIVDYRQADYFKQIFKVLEILGFEWANRLVHVSYGVVSLPSGMMSSRKGNVISADQVLERLYAMEKGEMAERGSDTNSETFKDVALAAFRYPLLKVDYKQNITFDFDLVTRFEGDTGPYLQYTHARACSLLKKASTSDLEVLGSFDFDSAKLEEAEERVVKFIYRFPEIVLSSGEDFAPNYICNYLYDLASRFNSFYNKSPIISEKESIKRLQGLLITKAFAQVMRNGLNLLGISSPEKM